MNLSDLEIYKISREISRSAGRLYEKFNWQTKKIMGDQWIRAVNSIGAHITEGFSRYHYLDKNKFHFNARGSLFEALHWTELLEERKIIDSEDSSSLKNDLQKLSIKLNNFISKIKKDAASK